jgi:hypothetical protein
MPSHSCAIAASLFKQITESPSVSDVTTIEYNRWLMENGAREGAFERKKTREEEARLRTAMQDKYKTMGKTSVAELKEQMAMAKAEVEAFQKDNATRGKEVKEEVDALRKARKEQTTAWLEHGSQLSAELGKEQKRRIAETIGTMTTRKNAASKALKQQCKDEEKVRAERQQRELEDKIKLKNDMKTGTSDEVTSAAKESFYMQRKQVGDTTRTDMKAWKEGRQEQRDAYAAKAAAAKLEASQTKKAAKEALAAHSAAKAKAAKEMRDKKNNMESNYGKVKSDVGMTKKQIHDMLRTRKFVSKDAAENMRQKKTLSKLDG